MRGGSGCDKRERTVSSVLNGLSVLFYHYRYSRRSIDRGLLEGTAIRIRGVDSFIRSRRPAAVIPRQGQTNERGDPSPSCACMFCSEPPICLSIQVGSQSVNARAA